tara:strand:+ start:614 stop:1420 length:807 start_codon:yes stop_codon:yes gene_type:complete
VSFVHNGEEIAVATVKKNPTAKEVWDTLSGINVNEHTEDKGGLTYLSWAWAWSIMMDHYPQLVVKWHGMTDESGVTRDITTYPGGTASVCCSVTIGDDVKREMWLPVMDHRNKAIANPDSRAISDAKQRCLTKCLGVLGLGAYIYAGEDFPRDVTPAEAVPKKVPPLRATKKTPKKSPEKAVEEAKQDQPSLTYEEVSVDEAITNLKATVTDLHKRGWTPADDAAKKQITDAIKGRDIGALVRLRREILNLAESALKLHDIEEGKHDE